MVGCIHARVSKIPYDIGGPYEIHEALSTADEKSKSPSNKFLLNN